MSLFRYQAKRWIDSFVVALDGLDTLVFVGGISENAPFVSSRICLRIDFLDIELDEKRCAVSTGVIIPHEIEDR